MLLLARQRRLFLFLLPFALRGDFGVREFIGPNGPEQVPEKRSLLVTLTPTIISTRGLQNRPSDISRPTDKFGSVVRLKENDIFVMPAVLVLILCVVHAAIRREGLPAVSASNMSVGELLRAMQIAREVEQARQPVPASARLDEGPPTDATAVDENVTSLSSARHSKEAPR